MADPSLPHDDAVGNYAVGVRLVLLLFALAFSLIWARVAVPQDSSPARPNIILIVADDLGYGDLGAYGQTAIQTPSLDQLAAEGMRFTQAYAGAPLCAPSRCTLMTGFHSGHCTIRTNAIPVVPLRRGDITIGEILEGAGYTTGEVGKWGLGGGRQQR